MNRERNLNKLGRYGYPYFFAINWSCAGMLRLSFGIVTSNKLGHISKHGSAHLLKL